MSSKYSAFMLQLTYLALAVFTISSCASILHESQLSSGFDDRSIGEANSISKVINSLKDNPSFAAQETLDELTSLRKGEKRSFNPWGGKRSFNPWGGKRSDELEAELERRGFQAWGGKRSLQPLSGRAGLDLLGKYGVKRVFNPWGGKRSMDSLPDEMVDDLKRRFNAWGGKRAEFNPWGGKRAEFNPWGGKRSAFNPWGGKRSIDERYDSA